MTAAKTATTDARSPRQVDPSDRRLGRFRTSVSSGRTASCSVFLTWRTILVRYKQTALGVAWAVLQPLLLMVVLTLFFSSLREEGRRSRADLLLRRARAVDVLRERPHAVVQQPRRQRQPAEQGLLPTPRSAARRRARDAARLRLAFLILLVMMVCYGIYPQPIAVVVDSRPRSCSRSRPPSALGLWLSALNVAYRDVQYVVPFLVQLGLFASGVVFAATTLAEPWQTLLGLNPMAGVVTAFRWALLGTAGNGPMLVLSVASTIVISVVSGSCTSAGRRADVRRCPLGLKRALVTGSSGLIGSEMVAFLDERGWAVARRRQQHARATSSASTATRRWNLERLRAATPQLRAPRRSTSATAARSTSSSPSSRPALIVHCAAQPSPRPRRQPPVRRLRRQRRRHAEPARGRAPARARVAVRRSCRTNKVYGDAPNELELVELETRWDYADPAYADGIDETMRIDATMHCALRRVEGRRRRDGAGVRPLLRHADRAASAAAASPARTTPASSCTASSPTSRKCDARGLAVPDLRLQGQAGARQHPLATTSARAIMAFAEAPRAGAVYNLGGGRGEQRLDARGDRALRGALRPQARLEYVDEAAPRRPHLLHLATSRASARTTRSWELSIVARRDLRAVRVDRARPGLGARRGADRGRGAEPHDGRWGADGVHGAAVRARLGPPCDGHRPARCRLRRPDGRGRRLADRAPPRSRRRGRRNPVQRRGGSEHGPARPSGARPPGALAASRRPIPPRGRRPGGRARRSPRAVATSSSSTTSRPWPRAASWRHRASPASATRPTCRSSTGGATPCRR